MTVSLIPETAPFTAEQRAWLNGFLAGWVGLQIDGHAIQPLPTTMLEALPASSPPAEPEESYPWHDPNLTIVQRLELADGKPLERRLMAAMAQLDCGACGYVCKSYSEAIAAGNEKNLTLCSPGGRNTVKAIKQLIKESGSTEGNGSVTLNGAVHAVANGHATNGCAYNRQNPFLAKIKSTRNLNKPGSAKHTAHVVIDLSGSGLSYRPGDALGVYPTNSPQLVDTILATTKLDSDATVTAPNGEAISLRDALRRHYCLRGASEGLMTLLAQTAVSDAECAAVKASLADESYEHFDVLDALQLAPSARLSDSELLDCLSPLSPRLYSIASSPKAHPDEVHLTVGRVEYKMNGRQRFGVASTMFTDRMQAGDPVGVFLHAASGFVVPADPSAPMIMVGPGTGIAPFRAFLEEREAVGATGKNWLFFGDQCAATDFLYQDQWAAMQSNGFLTRFDVAFSRDQVQKVYVQDKMREQGAELFRWLEEGGYFFVCGDAKRMAADVDLALHDIVVSYGRQSVPEAKLYVEELKRQHRYVRDIY